MISGRSRLQTYEHLKPRTRQVAGGDQTIVARTHDDRVEILVRGHGAFAQAGTFCVVLPACSVASTAVANASSVSARHEASCAADMNHGSRESGSHKMPSSCNTCAMAS